MLPTQRPRKPIAPGYEAGFYITCHLNLVPRACDPREGTRGSGIIRFREESGWPLKGNAYSSILARIPGFRQQIIPEPHVPSRGSQAQGTRLLSPCPAPTSFSVLSCGPTYTHMHQMQTRPQSLFEFQFYRDE